MAHGHQEQLDAAHLENVRLMKGLPVSRQGGDCDTCHLNKHADLVETPVFLAAPDSIRKSVEEHYRSHVAQLFADGKPEASSKALREAHDVIQSNQMGDPSDKLYPSTIVPSP